jgi:transposase
MDSPFGSHCDYRKEKRMSHTKKGDNTMQVARIGFDIAKSSFQIHGVDAHGKVVVRKQLRRSKVLLYFAQLPPCLVGLEACGGAHYWRESCRS